MYNYTKSLEIAEQIYVEQKECFQNAIIAFLTLSELQDGCYVEGFAVPDPDMPINSPHGWIELSDSTIIDPTYASYGHEKCQYFPAVKYTLAQVKRRVYRKSETLLPLALEYEYGGRKLPAYKKAHDESFKAVFGIYADELMKQLRNVE